MLLTQGRVVALNGTHLEEQFSNDDQTANDIFGDVVRGHRPDHRHRRPFAIERRPLRR